MILFGVVVIAITIWQVQVVPSQNAGVEYEHSRTVETDLQELRDAILDAPGSESPREVTLAMGTDYPDRTLYVNPAPTYGSLETVEEAGLPFRIRVENATATQGAGRDVSQVWDGDLRSFDTSLLEYQPHYNELSFAPRYVYEHSVLYETAEGVGTVSEQSIVDGREISLVALGGSLDHAGVEPAGIAVSSDAAGVRSVSVYNRSAPVVLAVPTRLSRAEWNRTLQGEFVTQGGHVESVDVNESIYDGQYGLARIELSPDVRYSLQLASATVGRQPTSQHREVSYLSVLDGTAVTTDVGESVSIEVEARDEFDNALSNRTVTFSTESGSLRANGVEGESVQIQTGRRGRASVTFVPSGAGTETVRATTATTGSTAVDVRVGRTDGGTYGVQWLQDEYVVDVGETYNLTANTTESVGDVPVEFAFQNSSVAQIEGTPPSAIGPDGVNLTIDVEQLPPDGNASYVYVSTSGGGDRAALSVGESNFEVTITETNSSVDVGETLTVSATIDNTGDRRDTQDVDLVVDGQVRDTVTVTLQPETNSTETLSWTTQTGDAGDYTAVIETDDDSDSTSVSVDGNFIPGFGLAAVLVVIVLVTIVRRIRTDEES